MRYEGNPKHKEPWQRGRKGTMCPRWSHGIAGDLLKNSVADGEHQRYATARGIAFAGQEHSEGVWHGYPVPWEEVPEKIANSWLAGGLITRRQIRVGWAKVRESCDE